MVKASHGPAGETSAHVRHESRLNRVTRVYIALTGGARIGSRSLNGRPVPALDGVQNALFLLAAGGEAGHLFTGNDRLAGSGVDDSGEDGTAVAAV